MESSFHISYNGGVIIGDILSNCIYKEQNAKISFLEVGGFFSQNFWGTYKIKSVCICTGHLPLSGYGLIPNFEFYHTPLSLPVL